MCKCKGKCGCNITQITKGEKGDAFNLGYKLYAAKLNQESTLDPSETLFKNELSGPVVWTRSSGGIYVGTLAGAFTLNKTSALIGYSDNADIIFSDVRIFHTDVNTVTIKAKIIDLVANTRTLDDDLLINIPVQIMVFD